MTGATLKYNVEKGRGSRLGASAEANSANRHAAGGATGRVCGDDPGFGRTEATLAGAAGCLRNGSNAEGIDGRAAGLVNGEQIAALETGLVAASQNEIQQICLARRRRLSRRGWA